MYFNNTAGNDRIATVPNPRGLAKLGDLNATPDNERPPVVLNLCPVISDTFSSEDT